MKYFKKLGATILFIAFQSMAVEAQSTFSIIADSIFRTTCLNSCHNRNHLQGGFSLSGFNEDIYNAIVNVVPNNAAAAASGMLLVDPANPENSFLLKKLIHALDNSDTLDVGEGVTMPINNSLTKDKIELIRQWILFGAPDNGVVVDYQMLQNYYGGLGKQRIAKPAAPPVGQGFQLHVGPIFIPPATEIEYFKKIKLPNSDMNEVIKIAPAINPESHHLILYKHQVGADTLHLDVPRIETLQNPVVFDGLASYVAAWQNQAAHTLPAGTAYFWPANTVLDVNYHIPNISPDSILAAEVYLNVYTQTPGTAEKEMFTDKMTYGFPNPFQLVIPNNGQPTTFVAEQHDASAPILYKDIWLLQGHTHGLGIDFDVWTRDSSGNKVTQIYEGFFNQDYTTNQGFFDYAHPPVKIFEPQLSINMAEGLIHEATFLNNGAAPVTYGLTTNDEMFITFYQYTIGAADTSTTPVDTTIGISQYNNILLRLYPNPTNDVLFINTNAVKAQATIINVVGVAILTETISEPNQKIDISKLVPGVYFVQLSAEGKTQTKRILVY